MTMIEQKTRRFISCADTAKLVRKTLKDTFPATKFSVRSKGTSLTIGWIDGPTSKAVCKATDPFKGADFDGMNDSETYRVGSLNGEEVYFSAHYIHTEHTYSVELVTRVAQLYCDWSGDPMPEIKVSEVSGAYIDTFHRLRDDIMPLVYDVTGDELDTIAIEICGGRVCIKHGVVAMSVLNNEVQQQTSAVQEIDMLVAQAEHIHEQLEQMTQLLPVKPVVQTPVKKSSPSLPKNEQVDYRVLDVLKQGHVEGKCYYLPAQQLERKLYQRVNEVLERIGGKWTRKVKAHVFEDVDPSPLLDLIFETCEMPPKNPTAFFPTPILVAEELLNNSVLQRLPRGTQRILEPSAGKGDLASAVRAHCRMHGIDASIDCCEIVPRFRQLLQDKGFNVIEESDFLQYVPDQRYDAIVMNPPFAVEGDSLAYVTHIEHAWSLLTNDGILLAVVPAGLLFRDDKRIKQLRQLVETHGAYIELNGGAFAESGTGVKTALISMQK